MWTIKTIIKPDNGSQVFFCRPMLLSFVWIGNAASCSWLTGQERRASVALCCCSQWLDHWIMMFVVMISLTDVPEKNRKKKKSGDRVYSACAVSFWRMTCSRVEIVSWNYSIPQSTVWSHTIYYCWTLYSVSLESRSRETEKNNADEKIKKTHSCETICL